MDKSHTGNVLVYLPWQVGKRFFSLRNLPPRPCHRQPHTQHLHEFVMTRGKTMLTNETSLNSTLHFCSAQLQLWWGQSFMLAFTFLKVCRFGPAQQQCRNTAKQPGQLPHRGSGSFQVFLPPQSYSCIKSWFICPTHTHTHTSVSIQGLYTDVQAYAVCGTANRFLVPHTACLEC